MNFRVVDGDSFWDRKDDFVVLYNKNVPSKDIQIQLNLTPNQYNKLVRESAGEGLIIPRRRGQKPKVV